MVGITLSPEQVRNAPLEVRQWLEREIAAALSLQPEPAAAESGSRHLVACNQQEAALIFARIRSLLPAVDVFFDLGREGQGIGHGEIEAYRLVEMLRHARLQSMDQLAACLQAINEAMRDVRNDPNATLYVLDQSGFCLIAAATQRSIAALWRQLVGGQTMAGASTADGPEAALGSPSSTQFAPLVGTVPPAAVHLGDAFPNSATTTVIPGGPAREA